MYVCRSLSRPKQEVARPPWSWWPSDLPPKSNRRVEAGEMDFGVFRRAPQEVDFSRFLPTWRRFLCSVVSGQAPRGGWRPPACWVSGVCERRGWRKRTIPQLCGLSQPPGADPLTSEHVDSCEGDTGSVFGLSAVSGLQRGVKRSDAVRSEGAPNQEL